MSRRNISPARGRMPMDQVAAPIGLDERELIIKKLKEELIIARSKEKQVVILENYLAELKQKIRIISQDLRRKDNDIKSKTDLSLKTINDLKRQVEIFKGELKNKSIELGQQEASLLQIKRHLAKRNTELEKVKKQTMFLKEENQRLMQENAQFATRYDDVDSELSRIQATNRNYETRIADINSKIGQVKAYIGDLNNEARILKDKLKKYEQENNNISDDLNANQDNIDDLERVFSEEHQNIKNQIDNYIELEHKNERILTETRHKINLCKAENQKTNELNLAIQKVDKSIAAVTRDNQAVQDEIKKYSDNNHEFNQYNDQLEKDLTKCQIHLQNLMKYNAQIQEELEKYLREDQQIIAVLRRKRAVDLIPVRESRKITERTYV